MRPILHRAASRGFAPLLVAALLTAALPRSAEARDAVYRISEEEGYGIAECMHEGQACGRVIADSWCESHGHAHATAYGMGSDMTGSIASPTPALAGTSIWATPVAAPEPAPAPNEVVIRCGE